MTDTVNTPAESLEYRTEVKQLLDILAHSLYTDREIFLRELISNASDALNRVQFEMLTNHEVVDPERELAIWIDVDEEAKTITLRDSGIGMNRDELVENLGTIAHSGARTFLQNAGQGQNALEEIIGQFGVGFYSVFMVADEVTVTSRSFRAQDAAATWRSQGGSTFSLAPAEQAERGTALQIQLKADAGEFASTWRLESIIRKHSDYVSFPIYVKGKDGEYKVSQPADGPLAPAALQRGGRPVRRSSTGSSRSTTRTRCSTSTWWPTRRPTCAASSSCPRAASETGWVCGPTTACISTRARC